MSYLSSLDTPAVLIMTASVNRMPVAETWERMEKTGLSNNSSQPDFIPLNNSNDSERSNRYGGGGGGADNQQETLNGYQQPSFSSQAKRKRLITGESTVTCTPWKTKDYTCDPPGLHEEICDFYDYMRPRPSEVQMRSEVILRTMSIILQRWPQAKVQVFGSFCTALFLPTGDIDLVVNGHWPTTPLFSLEEDLRRHNIAMEDSILVLDKTMVPIIKFIDKLTEVRVDVSFNQLGGINGALLIQQYIQKYPFLPKLVFVLKQFLYERNLHEVYYGGISSYSLVLLLVSFLQHHPRHAAVESNPNLGVLLIEFFELYGRHFNYMKTGISLLNEGAYFAKEERSSLSSGKNSLLYVEDPCNEDENAAGGCFGLWQIKQSFDYAFCRLHSTVLSRESPIPMKNSLLSEIITVSKEVEEYRNWVENNWRLAAPLLPPFYYPVHPAVHPPLASHAPYVSPSVPMSPQVFVPPPAEADPSSSKYVNQSASNSTPPTKSSSSSSTPSSSTSQSRGGERSHSKQSKS